MPPSIGTPALWATLLGVVLALFVLDFLITRRPHEVSLREAVAWSAFYVALPLGFGGYVWSAHGSQRGLEYYSGYLVEKSLSVDNLFVFMMILGAFAVPKVLEQRVLLYGIAGALVLRGVFIALGAAALAAFDWVFLVFGLLLAATGAKLLRDTVRGTGHAVDVDRLRSVQLLRRLMPVTDRYDGPRLLSRLDADRPGHGTADQTIDGTTGPGAPAGRRALTPFALVVATVLTTDVIFAVDSVPAVYGITGDPFLVFATNAFALLGLRSLYFVLQGALSSLVHLGYGLAAVLAFIGAKLALHWAHLHWPAVPEISTLLSLGVIVAVLLVTTATSLLATRSTGSPVTAGSAR